MRSVNNSGSMVDFDSIEWIGHIGILELLACDSKLLPAIGVADTFALLDGAAKSPWIAVPNISKLLSRRHRSST